MRTRRWPLQARRTAYVLFYCQDDALPDLGAFFRGEAAVVHERRIYALSLLTRGAHPISREELDLVLSLPSDRWHEVEASDWDATRDLARKGIVLTDDLEPELAALCKLDESIDAADWNLYSAFHYLMTKWSGVDLRASPDEGEFPPITEQTIADFVTWRGRPPDPFASWDRPLEVTELPLVRRHGGLYQTLAARKTTRGYDRRLRLGFEDLAHVLYQVWGCHGTAPILDDLFCIKRTSPSGGGLHPVEVYPLVTGVEGLDRGLYHYNVRDHALELIERLGESEAVALAADFVCGQNYLGSAHVSFVMTARFPRSYWKYPRQQKAYTVLLMDAAHLSQTLYIVAADLGLGAYVTAAVNGADIEERLGLDGVSEGVVAVAGCGHPLADGSPFEPRFAPYVPRETAL
jgi:putative peptide maturation dehydrogenase